MPVEQRQKNPIFYEGQLHDHYFWFLRDRALCNRLGINRDDSIWPLIPYDHFRNRFAEYQSLDMPISALDGNILIYRTRALGNSDCLHLDLLVKFARLVAANGSWDKGNVDTELGREGKRKAEDIEDGILLCKMGSPPPDFPTVKRPKVRRNGTKKAPVVIATIEFSD